MEGGHQSARRLALVAKRLASTLAELAPQTIILIDANQGGATVAEFLEDFRPSSRYPSASLALSRDNSEAEVGFQPTAKITKSTQVVEAEVGIDPENSISDRKIAEFACQSTTIPHYSATILLLSFHSTLLAILLAITRAGTGYRR